MLDTKIICREQGDGDRKNVEAALQKKGLLRKRLPIRQEAFSAEITKELVKAGVAIAYISSLAVERELKHSGMVSSLIIWRFRRPLGRAENFLNDLPPSFYFQKNRGSPRSIAVGRHH